MLDHAGSAFDPAQVRAGDMTPVFFGSAANNFGVQLLLDGYLALSSPPRAMKALSGPVAPEDPRFSGFVFKIQANMDPKHRDRIAFVRVCSGHYTRGIKLKQLSTGKTLAVNNAITFMAQDRNITDDAYAGDIIGIPNHGTIGSPHGVPVCSSWYVSVESHGRSVSPPTA